MVKNTPAMWETWVWSLDWEDPLEAGMATHTSILAWRIPMERGTWRALGSQRVRHDWVTKHSTTQHWLTDLIYFFFSLENVFLKFFHSAIAFNSRIAFILFIHFNIDEQLGCLQLLVFPNKAPVSKPIQLPSWIHVRVISTFYTGEWEFLTNTSYFMVIKWFTLHFLITREVVHLLLFLFTQ